MLPKNGLPKEKMVISRQELEMYDNAFKVYIAGPMSGMPMLNQNAFHEAEKNLKRSNLFREIINPAKLDTSQDIEEQEQHALTDKEYRKNAIARDLSLLVECDSIYMLSGWENSKGAQVEHALANYLGLTIFYQSKATI